MIVRLVFADTGYFIASLNDRDELHERAVAVAKALSPLRIVTTQMVLVELLNQVSDGGEHRRNLAVELIHELENSSDVEIVPQTATGFADAMAMYTARADQPWSLTDCASFLVMEERNITEALAYDRDFQQAGFVALLRESTQ